MYWLLHSFTLNINLTWTITSRHLEQFWHKPSQSLKLKKKKKNFTETFLLKAHTDLVLIFPPQIILDTSVRIHFRITLILLSTFAQDIHIWAFFEPILAIITSELRLKFQNL